MEVGGGSVVEGAGRPSSAKSMTSSLSEEESDRSCSEGGGALVREGRIGLALHSLLKASWLSPQWGQWGGGGWAPAVDSLGVAALGAGGVLPSVSRASMMKRTVWGGGVFLGALGRGVSKSVAVGILGVAVSLRCLFDLEAL